MDKRDYEIFSGETLVAVWESNRLRVVNETLLPLYLRKIQNADLWLETRAIDGHRANSRLLKKALRLVGYLAEKVGAEKDEKFEAVDYVEKFAYESTKQLFEEGYIKATKEKKVELDF